jgi:hypothetical protein
MRENDGNDGTRFHCNLLYKPLLFLHIEYNYNIRFFRSNLGKLGF